VIWGGLNPDFSYIFQGWHLGPGNSLSGVSADGNIVVGMENGQATRWTLNPASTNIIGSWASSTVVICADGNTVAGTRVGPEACFWTTNGEVSGLGFLPGATDSATTAISGDGKTIVGVSGGQAFLWNQGSGIIGLGDLPGGTFSSKALAVSFDGSIVVGWGNTDIGQEAFIWDATNGMRNLRTVLQSYGLNLNAITLSDAAGVSWNANAFCGNGTGGAWFASLRPTLKTSLTSNKVVFIWPTNEVGPYAVEWASTIRSTNSWSPVSDPVTVSNDVNMCTVSPTNSAIRFYRLRKQ
jgi:hypothetical protein